MAPEAYLALATSRVPALGAICFTEHRLYPEDPALDETYAKLSEQYCVRIFKGIEADTNLGHLLIFGVTPELRKRFDLTSRMLRADRLIEFVHDEGGIAVPAHPFRESGYGDRLDDLLSKLGPALSVVEAINGQNTLQQNTDAVMACEKLGLTAVGGSDAHFATPRWFMTCASRFEREVTSVAELCAELRAGRAQPYFFDEPSASTQTTDK
ncbi:MAG TPA: PHP-associated domain-containing protein [Candidatus Binataceae bacterium]|nr:PHP-associated domain-containing protein [Candidatus Binataceae bacterium]